MELNAKQELNLMQGENIYRNAKQVRCSDLLGVHNFCIAAMVATLTISFDEQPLDKSWTGFFNP